MKKKERFLFLLGVHCFSVSSCADVVLIIQGRIILIIDSWHSSSNLEFFISELFPYLLSCLHMNKNLKALARILTQSSCWEERSWKFRCNLMLNSPCGLFLDLSVTSEPWSSWASSQVSERPLARKPLSLWRTAFPQGHCLLAGHPVSPRCLHLKLTGYRSGLAKMNSLCYFPHFFLRKKACLKTNYLETPPFG